MIKYDICVCVCVRVFVQLVHVQTITSAIVDTSPQRLVHQKRWVTLAVCIMGSVLGLPFVTQASTI